MGVVRKKILLSSEKFVRIAKSFSIDPGDPEFRVWRRGGFPLTREKNHSAERDEYRWIANARAKVDKVYSHFLSAFGCDISWVQ